MKEKVLRKPHSYLDPTTGTRISYMTEIKADFAEGPLASSLEYRPLLKPQTTNFGIDRIDLKIDRRYVDESRIRYLYGPWLTITTGGRWCRISINRELFDHTSSYRKTIVTILKDLFDRNLLCLAKTYQREGQAKKTICDQQLNESQSFRKILKMVSFDMMEIFFDHAKDPRTLLGEKDFLQYEEETLYSRDYKKTPRPFFQKKSLVKGYDKVACKQARQEEIYDYESRVRYRLELTLHKPSKPTFTWKSLDCANTGLIEIFQEDLAKKIHETCPDILALIDCPFIHEELKKIFLIKPKDRLRFSKELKIRRMEGAECLTTFLEGVERLRDQETGEGETCVEKKMGCRDNRTGRCCLVLFRFKGVIVIKDGFADSKYHKETAVQGPEPPKPPSDPNNRPPICIVSFPHGRSMEKPRLDYLRPGSAEMEK